MTTAQFFPYKTAPAGIALDIEPEGIELKRAGDGSLQIYQSGADHFILMASAILPVETITGVIAPCEQANPPVALRLVYRSLESRTRGTWEFKGDGTVFDASIVLKGEEWIGTLEVQAVLVRTSSNPDLPPDYARDLGSLLSWSAPPLRLLFDQPQSPPGGNLEVTWLDFGQDEWLKQSASQHLFALDTRGTLPRLLLNSAVPGAHAILNNNATQGPRARVRDSTYNTIVHQVWTSLLSMALGSLFDSSDSLQGTGPDINEVPEGWRRAVLLDWATYLFPEREPEDALDALVTASGTTAGLESIQSRIPTAIQTRFKTYGGFEGMAREIERL